MQIDPSDNLTEPVVLSFTSYDTPHDVCPLDIFMLYMQMLEQAAQILQHTHRNAARVGSHVSSIYAVYEHILSCVYACKHSDCVLGSKRFQHAGDLHFILDLKASCIDAHKKQKLLLLSLSANVLLPLLFLCRPSITLTLI